MTEEYLRKQAEGILRAIDYDKLNLSHDIVEAAVIILTFNLKEILTIYKEECFKSLNTLEDKTYWAEISYEKCDKPIPSYIIESIIQDVKEVIEQVNLGENDK